MKPILSSRFPLLTVSLILAVQALLFSASSVHAAERPNILFILADDQRNDSLGCAGHPYIKTPVLDNLAAQGVRFENAFVTTSICMASRACLFTGMTEKGHGFTGAKWPATPVLQEDTETSFPTLLRKEGYKTAFFGKNHVKWHQHNGLDMMFDVHQALSRYPSPYLNMPDGSTRHVDEVMGDKSIAFIDKQDKDTPFLLYMSFHIAHAQDSNKEPGRGHFPWPKAEDGLYDDITPDPPALGDPKYFNAAPDFLQDSMNRDRYFWRWDTKEKYEANMRAYYRMITGMDRIIGRAIEKLKEKDMLDNTIIMFLADNGYYGGDRGFAGKWSHYEQSLRVPMIVVDPRAPEHLRGRVISDTVISIDLSATILDEAAIEIPAKYQGRSLVPFLLGQTPQDWRTDFYCEHHFNHDRIPKWQGVRDNRYTYANYYEKGVELLYDREKDPGQLVNLATDPEHAEVLRELRNKCEDYIKQYSRPQVIELKEKLKPGKK
jgi:arylsulfatase A-like enzyme